MATLNNHGASMSFNDQSHTSHGDMSQHEFDEAYATAGDLAVANMLCI